MKALEKSRSQDIPNVELFREDLDSILTIFTEKCAKVTIEDEDFEYENLDELFEHRGPLTRRIKFSGSMPYITMDVGKGIKGSLYSSSEGEELFFKVNEVLSKRVRLIDRIFPLWLWGTLSMFGGIGLIPMIQHKTIIPLIALMAIYGGTVFAAVLRFHPFTTLHLVRRHEKKGFWRRNGDSVVLLTLGSVIGGVATWAFSLLLN